MAYELVQIYWLIVNKLAGLCLRTAAEGSSDSNLHGIEMNRLVIVHTCAVFFFSLHSRMAESVCMFQIASTLACLLWQIEWQFHLMKRIRMNIIWHIIVRRWSNFKMACHYMAKRWHWAHITVYGLYTQKNMKIVYSTYLLFCSHPLRNGNTKQRNSINSAYQYECIASRTT